MSSFTAMDIAASGLNVQRARMTMVASNLANVNATRDPEGGEGPYRRREMVVQAQPLDDFARALIERLPAGGADAESLANALRRVEVTEIRPDDAEPIMRHDPSHPDADPETGMVALPDISVMREMADLMAASRMYEANLATMRTARTMVEGALEIGRS